ncbi:MAG TPA: hypothetical protein VG223_08300 [Solirubrobacteraceae bacterium]|nr:hypothetical protein [Solirubrobacteraceae bacterium]
MKRLAPLLAVIALLAIGTGAALADGDPASDVLLGTDVFYPYAPVSKSAQDALNAAVSALRHHGSPLKIAIIASPTDLGVIPALFDHAQQYAQFLDTEISFQGPQPLLVVMPSGYGTEHLGSAATAAVAALAPPAGKGAGALTAGALAATEKIGAADGHPIAGATTAGTGAGAGAGAGSGGSTGLVIGLVVVAVLTTGGLVAATLRKRQGAT